MSTYAVVKTGGKQYRVRPGDLVRVEHLPHAVGAQVRLEDVLMVCRDGEVRLGTPNVSGVRVLAEVVTHGKGAKVVVFKYKSKTRYRRKNGHRQAFTDLKVMDISISKS